MFLTKQAGRVWSPATHHWLASRLSLRVYLQDDVASPVASGTSTSSSPSRRFLGRVYFLGVCCFSSQLAKEVAQLTL